ncbi:MAG: MBL fold metallo-hydrolase [Selenomonadaceae bacterium]|nr:MBL fold metallo-hydrolase [Selenomonadaceae bacterium]
MIINYLLNSGFLIRDEKILLVFDDFEDPAGIVDAAYDKGDFDRLYIFATHAHFDHFSTHIRAYAPKVTRYIFSNDIRRTKRVKIFPTDKITYMKRYSEWQDDLIKVWAYDSTDVGVSFLVQTPSSRIYHAGDFNWWHWENETPEEMALADKAFKKQIKRMDGMEADVAFFPVDGRLGSSQELGAIDFVAQTKVKGFVAMHRVDYPLWEPSQEFLAVAKDIPTWSPIKPGEQRTFDGEKFLED